MMKFIAAFAFVVAVAGTSTWPNGQPEPWFCHDIGCPMYSAKNVSVGGNASMTVEVRSYPASLWASTHIMDTSYKNATQVGFMRLFDYISGANVQKRKVEMTAPVLTRITPGAGPFCKSNFTVHFFVPYANQKNPPTPTGHVALQSLPAIRVAVASFGGYATEKEIFAAVAALGNTLQEANMKFDTKSFFNAGYDSPFRVFGRHNEVWLQLTTQ